MYTQKKVNINLYFISFIMDIYKERMARETTSNSTDVKEYCNCTDDRIVIGKKRPTIMVVDAFEKPDNTHTQRKLKEKDPY